MSRRQYSNSLQSLWFLPCFVLSLSTACALATPGKIDGTEKLENSVGTKKADPDCWKEIPFSLISQKNYTQAIKELKALVKRKPNCAGAYHKLAFCYERIHRYRLALKAIRKAPSFEGNYWSETLRAEEAGVLAHLGRYSEAASCVTEVMNLEREKDPASVGCRGTYYYHANQIDLAIDDLNAAIALYQRDINADVYYYRGLCFMRKRRFDDALRDFEKVNTMLGLGLPSIQDKSRWADYPLYLKNKKSLDKLKKKLGVKEAQ